MSALSSPFNVLPPVGASDRQLLYAIYNAIVANGSGGGSGGLTNAQLRASPVPVTVSNGASFSIPAFDFQSFAYFGSTNNIQTQVFKSGGSGGTTVATLTYTYVNGGAANDDLIENITQS